MAIEASSSASRATAWPATCWSAVFAAVHAYWALGGRVGLPAEIRMAERPALLAVNVAAIPLCMGAAALAHSCGRKVVTRIRQTALIAIATFCLAHSLPPLAREAIGAIASGGWPDKSSLSRYGLLLYEPWWLLGGLAFTRLALAMRARRRSSPNTA